MGIESYKKRLGTTLITMLAATVMAGEPDRKGPTEGVSQLLGKWRGSSSCVARNTSCHEETVVYNLSNFKDKPGYVSINADKIVNGAAVNMGTLEFRYDHAERMLVCEYSQGVWRIKVSDGKMEGSLTLPDGTEFRRVMLRKEP
jgi:hypothetical protein